MIEEIKNVEMDFQRLVDRILRLELTVETKISLVNELKEHSVKIGNLHRGLAARAWKESRLEEHAQLLGTLASIPGVSISTEARSTLTSSPHFLLSNLFIFLAFVLKMEPESKITLEDAGESRILLQLECSTRKNATVIEEFLSSLPDCMDRFIVVPVPYEPRSTLPVDQFENLRAWMKP